MKIHPLSFSLSPLQSVDGLPVYLKLLYHFAFNIMPHVQTAAIYGLFVVGPLYIALGVIGLFRRKTGRRSCRRATAVGGTTSTGLARSNIVRLAVPLTGALGHISGRGGGGSPGAAMAKEFVRYSPINNNSVGLLMKEDV